MNAVPDVSVLAAALTAAFLLAGAVFTFVGTLGLLRLRSFYQRVHAPTLGTTFGTALTAAASMIYFSALGTRPILHEVLILVLITATTPIALMVLVRAALFRDEAESGPPPPR